MTIFKQTLTTVFCLTLAFISPVFAQTSPFSQAGQVWIQIDAQRALSDAEARAELYEPLFSNLKGYQFDTGWYGLAIGPYDEPEAKNLLVNLINGNQIPVDSYVTRGANFTRVFWPHPEGYLPLGKAPEVKIDLASAPQVAKNLVAPTVPSAQVSTSLDQTFVTPVSIYNAQAAIAAAAKSSTTASNATTHKAPQRPNLNDQSPEAARAFMDGLDADEKRHIQRALQWFGTYLGSIDGQIGSGSRKSIADWQKLQDLDQTGALSRNQQQWLLSIFDYEAARFGFEKVTDTLAGINLILPSNLVNFSNYAPPFARYTPFDNSKTSILLISQEGSRDTLAQIYAQLMEFDTVPRNAATRLTDNDFTIEGVSNGSYVFIFARKAQETIKGFALFTPSVPDQSERRLAALMKRSFTLNGDFVLETALPTLTEAARLSLSAGLDARRPILSRSGFYVSEGGDVLTTIEVAQSCEILTVEGDIPMRLKGADPELGLALLSPNTALSPFAIARWQEILPQRGAKMIVSGYSYEDQLPLPTLTIGRYLSNAADLEQTGRIALNISTRPGDAGAPVYDTRGGVLGMILPDQPLSQAQLPPQNIRLAARSDLIASFLRGLGIDTPRSDVVLAQDIEDITQKALGMVVLVSCWAG